jgi:hypothetical protein
MVQTRRRDGKFGRGVGTADRGWSRDASWHDEPLIDEHGKAEGAAEAPARPAKAAAAKAAPKRHASARKPAAKPTAPKPPTPAQQAAAAKREEKARQADRARKAARPHNRALMRITKAVAKKVAKTVDNDRPI